MIALVTALLIAASGAGGSAGSAGGKAEFEEAVAKFQAGRHAEALPLFQRAYELSGHRASVVFGLAQCERALEMWDPAVQHFEEYLATNPSPEEQASVRETIAEIEQKRPSVISNPSFWITIGVIAAVVALGVGIGVAASSSGGDGFDGGDFGLRVRF